MFASARRRLGVALPGFQLSQRVGALELRVSGAADLPGGQYGV